METNELLAAAERYQYRKRGTTRPYASVNSDVVLDEAKDLRLLADWAIQQLTTPPADVEAELRETALRAHLRVVRDAIEKGTDSNSREVIVGAIADEFRDWFMRRSIPIGLIDDLETVVQLSTGKCYCDEFRRLTEQLIPLLRLGRADGGKAVDEAWLKSVLGPKMSHDLGSNFQLRFYAHSSPSIEFEETGSGEFDLPECPTRGDVRRLCAALGAPLKESDDD